jgi:hypothetical protein
MGGHRLQTIEPSSHHDPEQARNSGPVPAGHDAIDAGQLLATPARVGASGAVTATTLPPAGAL